MKKISYVITLFCIVFPFSSARNSSASECVKNGCLSGLKVLNMSLIKGGTHWWQGRGELPAEVIERVARRGSRMVRAQSTLYAVRQVFRRRFQEAARRREEVLTENVRRAGVDLFTLSTEEDLVRAIVRIASLRKRRRR